VAAVAELGSLDRMPRLFAALILISAVAHAENPPNKSVSPSHNDSAKFLPIDQPGSLVSPDHRYSIDLIAVEWPGSSPSSPCMMLQVHAGDHVLSKYPSFGFLVEAYWSSDGKFVAVNNRRANSGDYLWIFRLSDGKAVKLPDDQPVEECEDDYGGDEKGYKRLVNVVHAHFPEYSLDDFRKRFTFAIGWKTASEPRVKSNVAFRNLEDGVMEVFETYKVTTDKVILVDQHVE
jgi:hypothetical protein